MIRLPAAVEQLTIWAQRIDVPIIKHQQGSDPAAVAFDACDAALARGTRRRERPASDQLGLFSAPDPRLARIAEELRALSLDRLTPLEALNLLAELKSRLE